ncbi:MAG: type VI secretion system tip protein VgrG [Cyanobacteria bacterium]|nr:type VI secretion system tip protein VgrG [Cyanobacteriota bacterium]
MALPDIKISCDGRPLPAELELLDLEIQLELNRIPQASLTLLDGSVAERCFEISDGGLFKPGSRISIALGYQAGGPAPKKIFEGIVTRHAVSAGGEGLRLKVNVRDRAITMTRTRHSRVHANKNDAAVMRQLISQANLKVGRLARTPITHPELVQFNVSDWDFIVCRSDVLGLAIRVQNGAISALPLALGAPKRILDYGLDDTRELELELDGVQQWASIKVQSWDRAKLAPTAPVRAKPANLQIGNQSDTLLAKAVEASAATLLHGAPTAPDELQAWADARLLRSRLSLLRGTAVVDGSADLQPLDTVEIKGVGQRFNGKALVSGITHTIDGDGWRSQLRLGLSADWFARTAELAEAPAAGLLPPAIGLQIATVASLAVDPDGELRVQVKLPQMAADQALQWARPLSPDAGAGRGFVFRPEVGDEVVIGFLNDDPRQPLILGALFGSKNKPPQPVHNPDKTNPLRAIVSRAGSRIVFDDKTPALHIETTAAGKADGEYKNKISLDEKAKTITIEDQHNNKIELSDKGISLTSDKDIMISAKGNIKLDSKANLALQGQTKASLQATAVEVAAKSKFSAKAAQVDLAADATFAAQGGAEAKLGSNAMVEIKAALVKIN